MSALAADQRAHPRQQLVPRERLDQIIVGPQVQTRHAIVERIAAVTHMTGAWFPFCRISLSRAQTVLARQDQVENDAGVLVRRE